MGIRDGICIANSILCGFVRNSHFGAYPSHGYSKWNKYGFLVIMINDGIRKYPIDKPSCHSGGMKAPGAKPRCSICWQGAMPWACLSHNFRPSFVELWSKLLQNSCRNERNVEIALHILDRYWAKIIRNCRLFGGYPLVTHIYQISGGILPGLNWDFTGGGCEHQEFHWLCGSFTIQYSKRKCVSASFQWKK